MKIVAWLKRLDRRLNAPIKGTPSFNLDDFPWEVVAEPFLYALMVLLALVFYVVAGDSARVRLGAGAILFLIIGGTFAAFRVKKHRRKRTIPRTKNANIN